MQNLIHIWSNDFLAATVNPNTKSPAQIQMAYLLEHLHFALGDEFELVKISDTKYEIKEKQR